MPHPRTIRTWLKRANWFLALVVIVMSVDALLGGQPAERVDRSVYVPDVALTGEPFDVTRRPIVNHDELIGLVRLFHGVARPRVPAPAAPTEETKLPLRAFRIAMVLRNPGVANGILLKSKDPSRKDVYVLMEGRAYRDALLENIRYEGTRGYFRVRRGAESFIFQHEHARPFRGGGLSVVGRRRSVRARESRVAGRASPRGATNVVPRGIKGLPFYGRDGRVVGFRVTGVRPGSRFANIGLKSGDVIQRADDAPLSDVADFRTRLAEGWLPNALVVRRGLGAKSRSVELADG